MRILNLTQFYPPILGGEERHVKSLSDELVARGHEVAIGTLLHPGLPVFEVDHGVRIYRINSTTQRIKVLYQDKERRHAPSIPDPEAVLAIREIIRKEQPDVIHAHNWLGYSFLPLKTWSAAPLVITLHDYSLSCAKKRLMKDGKLCTGPGWVKCIPCSAAHYGPVKGIATFLGNQIMGAVERSHADMFLAVSRATADGNGLLEGRVPYRIIPNFVPNNFGKEIPESHPLTEQLPQDGYLLYVGDLTREKGVHVLLKAYTLMKHAPPLVLVGRKHAHTPDHLPENVKMLHSWPHKAVMAAWHRSSIAIIPSIWSEPFGIVALEAMASGRPVIASQIGGLRDVVVDGETGLLVPPGDVQKLKEAIEFLISQPELRMRMGAAGKARVQQFKAESVVPLIEQVYHDLLIRKEYEKQALAVEEKAKGGFSGEAD